MEALDLQLASLGLDDDDQKSMARELLEDTAMSQDEALECVASMLDREPDDPELRKILLAWSAHLEAERAAEADRIAAEAAAAQPSKPAPAPTAPDPAREEIERRAKILAMYGNVAEPDPSEVGNEDEERAATVRAQAAAAAAALAAGRKIKKSQRRAQDDIDPLLRPNINSATVAAASQLQRDKAAAAAAAKRDKDKHDLAKQRADQAQRKADAQKRAAKGERKA